jgi:hypothetical protein
MIPPFHLIAHTEDENLQRIHCDTCGKEGRNFSALYYSNGDVVCPPDWSIPDCKCFAGLSLITEGRDEE